MDGMMWNMGGRKRGKGGGELTGGEGDIKEIVWRDVGGQPRNEGREVRGWREGGGGRWWRWGWGVGTALAAMSAGGEWGVEEWSALGFFRRDVEAMERTGGAFCGELGEVVGQGDEGGAGRGGWNFSC